MEDCLSYLSEDSIHSRTGARCIDCHGQEAEEGELLGEGGKGRTRGTAMERETRRKDRPGRAGSRVTEERDVL